MKKIINLAKEFSPSIVALILPALAFAQQQPGPPTVGSGVPTSNITSLGSVLNLLCVAFGWAFWFLIVLAIIFVMVAAFRYLAAAGNPENVKAAGTTLLYAAIAIAVALIAKSVPLVIGSFLANGASLQSC